VVAFCKAVKFSSIHFDTLIDTLSVAEKFEKITTKCKSDALYVYFAVDWNNYLIVNFVVSIHRDIFEAIQLILPCEPKFVYSDHLP